MFEQLEQTRKKEVKNVLISLACVVLIVFILMMVTPRFERMMVLMFGGIFGLVIVLVVAERSKKKFMMAYKQEFLKKTLEKEFDQVTVNFEEGFSEQQIRDGHLVNLYDRFYSDDYISATYNDVAFECSDIKIEDVVRSGKHTSVVTRFQGLYLKVNLKKNFRGWTVVREKEFLDNGNPRSFWSEMPELEKINVESEEFNQKFSVYSSDGTEAFYLLTPRFMERMMTLESCFEGRCYFGFLQGQLHIAIDSREDHFDISLFEAVDEYRLYKHQQEIDMIKGIVELVSKECETTWNTF